MEPQGHAALAGVAGRPDDRRSPEVARTGGAPTALWYVADESGPCPTTNYRASVVSGAFPRGLTCLRGASEGWPRWAHLDREMERITPNSAIMRDPERGCRRLRRGEER